MYCYTKGTNKQQTNIFTSRLIDVSSVLSQTKPVTCRLSHVTCQLHQQHQNPQPQTLPLLTPQLPIASQSAKKSRPKTKSEKYIKLKSAYDVKHKKAAKHYLDGCIEEMMEEAPGKAYRALKKSWERGQETVVKKLASPSLHMWSKTCHHNNRWSRLLIISLPSASSMHLSTSRSYQKC